MGISDRRLRILLGPLRANGAQGILLGLTFRQFLRPRERSGSIGLRPLTGDAHDKIIPRLTGRQRVREFRRAFRIVLRQLITDTLQGIALGFTFGQRLDPIHRCLRIALGKSVGDRINVAGHAARGNQRGQLDGFLRILIRQLADGVLQNFIPLRTRGQALCEFHRRIRIGLHPAIDDAAQQFGAVFSCGQRRGIGHGRLWILLGPLLAHTGESQLFVSAFRHLFRVSQRARHVALRPVRKNGADGITLLIASWKRIDPSHRRLRISAGPRRGDGLIRLRTSLHGSQRRSLRGGCGGVFRGPLREDLIGITHAPAL